MATKLLQTILAGTALAAVLLSGNAAQAAMGHSAYTQTVR